jgi:hypothetical protein
LGILQFWLRDCSEQVATDVIKNCKLKFTTRICKQSLWLVTSSKEEPIKYSEQMDFQLAIWLRRLQLAQSNLSHNIAIFRVTSGLTVIDFLISRLHVNNRIYNVNTLNIQRRRKLVKVRGSDSHEAPSWLAAWRRAEKKSPARWKESGKSLQLVGNGIFRVFFRTFVKLFQILSLWFVSYKYVYFIVCDCVRW